jgi:hypothetical protein
VNLSRSQKAEMNRLWRDVYVACVAALAPVMAAEPKQIIAQASDLADLAVEEVLTHIEEDDL